MKLSPTFFTRLGVPWLWGADVERGWVFMRFNAVPITALLMAPGSYAYGTSRLPREGGAVMAIRHRELPAEGVQFHPESVLTEHGKLILQNFLNR